MLDTLPDTSRDSCRSEPILNQVIQITEPQVLSQYRIKPNKEVQLAEIADRTMLEILGPGAQDCCKGLKVVL